MEKTTRDLFLGQKQVLAFSVLPKFAQTEKARTCFWFKSRSWHPGLLPPRRLGPAFGPKAGPGLPWPSKSRSWPSPAEKAGTCFCSKSRSWPSLAFQKQVLAFSSREGWDLLLLQKQVLASPGLLKAGPGLLQPSPQNNRDAKFSNKKQVPPSKSNRDAKFSNKKRAPG